MQRALFLAYLLSVLLVGNVLAVCLVSAWNNIADKMTGSICADKLNTLVNQQGRFSVSNKGIRRNYTVPW